MGYEVTFVPVIFYWIGSNIRSSNVTG